MPALSPQEVSTHLTALPGWQVVHGELTRTFKFEDFLAALRFVNRVAELAEAASHHPDIDIRYNKVTLKLVTHDEGGLTPKDFSLAPAVEGLSSPAQVA